MAVPPGQPARTAVSVIAALAIIGAGAALAAVASAQLAPVACRDIGAGCGGRPGTASLTDQPSAVRVVASAADGFRGPSAVAAGNGRLWVTNALGNSVTEIDAGTGRLLHTAAAGFSNPTGLAVAGSDVWVTNLGSDSLTRLRIG